MKLQLRILVNGKEHAIVNGRNIQDERVSIEDLNKIIEVEAYLERILGHRFHINLVREIGEKDG